MRAWYKVDPRKALETILWFVQRQGGAIDFYHILKVLFFADKKHLNEYGRPILGDTYEALPHGPVARTVYSLMKKDDPLEEQFLDSHSLQVTDYPIRVENRYWVIALRTPNMTSFSKSDIDSLEWAFSTYGHLTFDELERLTHSDRAWRLARERDGTIRYEDMLEAESDNDRKRKERQLAISAPGTSAFRRTSRFA